MRGSLGLSGITAISIAILVAFMPTITPEHIDPLGIVSIGAFAIAIPILAAALLHSTIPDIKGGTQSLWLFTIPSWVGSVFAITGVATAFWHVHWITGVVFLVGGALALVVLLFGSTRWPKTSAPTS